MEFSPVNSEGAIPADNNLLKETLTLQQRFERRDGLRKGQSAGHCPQYDLWSRTDIVDDEGTGVAVRRESDKQTLNILFC